MDWEQTILFEDNHILAAVKPQNMPAQEDASGDPDFLNALKGYLKEKYQKPGNVFLGLVHRLDRPTGGVMVFAKTSKAAARLSEQLRGGGFEKRYLAVLCGTFNRKSGTLENYLRKNSVNNMVYVCTQTEEGARSASLDYNILQEARGLSLAEIKLHTGRTHQIRVQTAAVNAPVYGDMRYGGERAVKGRLALWAYSLAFPHPVTGEKLRFMAEPPLSEAPWKLFDIKIGG